MPTKPASPLNRLLARLRRALVSLHESFRGEDLALRAASLTYLSVFSLVPLLTVALYLLTAIHQQAFHDKVHAFIQDLFSPAMRQDSAALLDKFLAAATSKAVRGIGLFTLVISAGSLLHSLGSALDAVWAVRRPRPWLLRIGLYLAALTLGPVLLAASLVGTAGLRQLLLGFHSPLAQFAVRFVSVAAAVIALTLLYVFGPNARVDKRAAFTGALVATIGWEIAKRAYAEFAAGIFRYNAIYGSLGAIPLFLLWIYVSWILVLFGARLAYALQRAPTHELVRWFDRHPMGDGLLALLIAIAMGRAEREGRPALDRKGISRATQLPDLLVARGLSRLSETGLLQGKRRFALTRNSSSIVATDLFRTGNDDPPPGSLPRSALWLIERLELGARGSLDVLSLSTLEGEPTPPRPTSAPALASGARKA